MFEKTRGSYPGDVVYLSRIIHIMGCGPGGGALGYFFGGHVPPGTPSWHPILEKSSPKIDTPF